MIFVLEPQAQIIWQEVLFRRRERRDLDGRARLDLGHPRTAPESAASGPFPAPTAKCGSFNACRDWGGNAATAFSGSGIAVPLVEQATRLEVGWRVDLQAARQ